MSAAVHSLDHIIERARAVRIEDEVDRRGISNLKRQGGELVGPCPVCGGNDRFAINVHKQVFNCRGCGGRGDVIALVQHLDGVSFKDAIATLTGDGVRIRTAPPPKPAKRYHDEDDRASLAAWLWSQRKPITEGTPPWLYLRKREYTGPIPATLAYLPANDKYPAAMISAFGKATEPEPGILAAPKTVTGVHLTRLTVDGNKSPNAAGKSKIMLGVCKGAPIAISPPNDLLGMVVTEGIEDALSVYQGTGLGVWAAGSAVFMPALAPLIPDYIETVTIYAHDDTAGRTNAIDLARAIKTRGIEVLVQGL
jgi:putative DNA primase/helicase